MRHASSFIVVLAMATLGGCARAESPSAQVAHAPPVARLGQHSAELHDACVAADWSRARGLVEEARDDSTRLAPEHVDRGSRLLLGTVQDALPLADRAIDRRARRSCTSGANAIALASAELAQADTARLEAWLRRLAVDGEYRDFNAAERDVVRARQAWERARQSTSWAHAADLDAALAACEGAVDERADRALMRASHAALDLLP